MTSSRIGNVLVLLISLSGQVPGQMSATGTVGQPRVQLGDLGFRLYQNYLIVVEGNLGELKDQNLLIDTGTEPAILDKRIARKLRLKQEDARLDTISHDVEVWRTVLPTCQIGPITYRNYNVLVQDLSFLEHGLGTRIDAIIGLDVLSSLSFTVDYRRQRIFFRIPETLDDEVTFESGPPMVTVMMTLNGKPMRLLVDTGASSLMLFKTRWSKEQPSPKGTFFLRPKQITRHSSSVGGELERQMIALRTVSLGRNELGRLTGFLVDGHGRRGAFDGLFNPAGIGIREIFFDFEHKKLGWKR